MNDTLIFLHLPRTGGTTLRDILSKQYSKPCTLKILSPVNGGKNPGTAVIVKLPINI